MEYTEKAFNFAHEAKAKFDDPKTTPEEKKSIFMTLGWNYEVIDEKLNVSPCIWLEPIAKKKNLVEEEINRLELEKPKPHNAEHTSLEMCPVLRG